jgi:hypothetical protein
MSVHPRADEDRHIQATIEPCELPDGVELVYADNRDRQHTIGLKDVAPLDFGSAKPFRKPPAYRGQRNFPGWWWSATTRSHIAYESWLERHHIIEADRDTRVTGISGQPFQLTWPEGKKNVRHVPDLFLLMIDGACVTDCRPADKMDKDFRHKAAVTAAACSAIGWDYRVAGDPDPVWAANLRWLSGYRHPRFANEHLEGLLLTIFASPKPLGPAAQQVGDPIQVRPVLFHLLWRGHLKADLARPLGETTVITASTDPVGPA